MKDWTLDELPEPRQRGVGFGDMVASLVFLAVAAGAILWDHLIGFGYDVRRLVSFLTPSCGPGGSAGCSCSWCSRRCSRSRYIEGPLDVRLAVVNLCSPSLSRCRRSWLLSQQQLLNPEFFPTLVPADSAQRSTRS